MVAVVDRDLFCHSSCCPAHDQTWMSHLTLASSTSERQLEKNAAILGVEAHEDFDQQLGDGRIAFTWSADDIENAGGQLGGTTYGAPRAPWRDVHIYAEDMGEAPRKLLVYLMIVAYWEHGEMHHPQAEARTLQRGTRTLLLNLFEKAKGTSSEEQTAEEREKTLVKGSVARGIGFARYSGRRSKYPAHEQVAW